MHPASQELLVPPNDLSGASGNNFSSDSLITHFLEHRGHAGSHLGVNGKCFGLFSGDLKDAVAKREPNHVRAEQDAVGRPVSKQVKYPDRGFSLTLGANFDSCQRKRANHGTVAAPTPGAALSALLPRLRSSFGILLELPLPRVHVRSFPLALLNPPSLGS